MKTNISKSPGEVLEMERSKEPVAAIPEASREVRIQIKHILVPIDFSECSRKALRYAVTLAKEHQAAITLLFVVAPPPSGIGEFGAIAYSNTAGDVLAQTKKELNNWVAEEVHEPITTQSLARSGVPGPEIVILATNLPADLIVIATHGRTGLKHILLGSVAEYVVRRAPCPVLVVRELEREFI